MGPGSWVLLWTTQSVVKGRFGTEGVLTLGGLWVHGIAQFAALICRYGRQRMEISVHTEKDIPVLGGAGCL